jgi:hypothetical protein
MGLLPSSMRRHLPYCQAGIFACVTMVLPLAMHRRLHSPGIFAAVPITLLPSSQWRHCRLQAVVVALVVTMASLPMLMHRRLCHCHDVIVFLVALVPLSTLHGCCCPCCAGIVVFITPTSLLSCCMGVITVVALALLPPLSWWCLSPCHAFFPLVR